MTLGRWDFGTVQGTIMCIFRHKMLVQKERESYVGVSCSICSNCSPEHSHKKPYFISLLDYKILLVIYNLISKLTVG